MACQQDTDEYFLQDKNGNLGLKIDQCAADLSGSATPLEYKHRHLLAHSDSRYYKGKTEYLVNKIFCVTLNQYVLYLLNLSLNDFYFLKKVK